MRHKVIEVRQEVFNHNEHEVSKRWAFEEGVRVSFTCLIGVDQCSHVFFMPFHSLTMLISLCFLTDKETILPRKILGEDPAEQLEGVLGL